LFEQLALGLTLALVMAVTILGYRHPKAYQSMFGPMLISLIAFQAGIFLWSLSNTATFSALLPYLAVGKSAEALRASNDVSYNTVYSFVICGVVALWLICLRLLPFILKDDDAPGPRA
jgi:hypothetical protein